MNDFHCHRLLPTWARCALAVLLGATTAVGVQAAQTDLSSVPFTATVAAPAKPNIMLLMDTSGSIGWSHMPDEVETVVGVDSVGYKNSQCNVLYYNPGTTYTPPKNADGTFFPAPSFTAARYDAFDTTSTTVVNLSTRFQAYDNNSLRTSGYNDNSTGVHKTALAAAAYPQGAYYWVHTGGTTIADYKAVACGDADTGDVLSAYSTGFTAADGGNWKRVSVASASTAVQQNFAIWYAYYRTRLLLIKSAASLAFTPLTDSFRVGFITMNPKAKYSTSLGRFVDAPDATTINPVKYLPIADFDSTQRKAWFDKLFSQQPGGSSPAREGLARVGRHYAGKQDGINAGMTGDPVQFYCQQNFTIMTTDGYWNDQGESSTSGSFLGGPVDKSGTQLVGSTPPDYSRNPDGYLTDNTGDTPRPMWDGVPNASVTQTNKTVRFNTAPCGTYITQTTSQVNATTSQVTYRNLQSTMNTVQNLQSTSQTFRTSSQATQSTSQTTQSTFQTLQSTNQNRQNVFQALQSTTQTKKSTQQNLIATNQNLMSTVQNLQKTTVTQSTQTTIQQTDTVVYKSTAQNLKSTNQNLQSTTQTKQATIQYLTSTNQNLASTVQNLQSTTQTTSKTVKNLQSTSQNLRSTSQPLQSQTQVTQSTSQTTASTYQVVQATSQLNITTSQTRKSTSQLRSCDASTELCTPVPVMRGSCTPSKTVTCETVTTGPSLVASCTNDPASDSNNYTATTCVTTSTGPTPTGTCTADSAAPGNNYTTTSCPKNATSPTPVASCNASTANSTNAWTTTTCTPNSTDPNPVASCTPAAAGSANSYTSTTCATNNSPTTGVAACTNDPATSTNSYTATVCGSNNYSNTPVQSCSPVSPTSGNGYLTISCSAATTTNQPVASCSDGPGTAGNAWTTTTCSMATTSNVPVASCTPQSPNSGNFYTTTTCPAPVTTAPVGVSSCTNDPATSANSYVATVCGTNNTTNVPIGTCTATGPTSGNGYTNTTCPSANTTSNVPVATCTMASANSGNAYTSTSCPTSITTSNVPSASCTPAAANSGNSYVTTTCPAPITTAPMAVASCTPIAANSGNNYIATTCTPNNTTNVPVASCTVTGPTSGNSYVNTTCPPPVVATNVPVASCTPDTTPTSTNSYTTTTCSTNNQPNVPAASCTADAASSGNAYTATTCPAPTVSGPTTVGSCTPVAPTSANGYHRIDCSLTSNTTPSGNCTPQSPNAGNGFVTITCGSSITGPLPVGTCTGQSPNAGNGWTSIDCPPPNVTNNVPVLSCTSAGATSTNNWTTVSCPTAVSTGPTPIASCTPIAATTGNNYVATTCPTPVTTAAVAAASCTYDPPSSSNNYVATLCTPNNTTNVPVVSCTSSDPDSGNGYTKTTCGNNNQSNVPVATCMPQTGNSVNGWITINCASSATTTNVPVQSCTPASTPNAGNSYTTTTCTPNNTPNAPSGTCVASAATSVNFWTTTTCPTVLSSPVGVSTCTPITANAGNNWTTTNCGTNNASSTPVQTCTPISPTSGNGYQTVACDTQASTNVPVQYCTNSTPDSGNNWLTTTCSNANSNVPSGSCTPVTGTAANKWVTITCPVVDSGPIGTASCTPVAASSANNWTATTCPSNTTGSPTPVASCTPQTASSGNGWTQIACNTLTSTSTPASCTAVAASPANNYTQTACSSAQGTKLQYTQTTTITTYPASNGNATTTPTVSTTVGPAVDGVCYAPPTAPTVPNPTTQPSGTVTIDGTTVAGDKPPSGCTAWPCSVSADLKGVHSVNSLADVAQYYYVTDLRTAADWPTTPTYDVSTDQVPSVGTGPEDDRRQWQHMTTFSVALGVAGTLQYRPDYKTATTGDFFDIRCAPPHDQNTCKNWPLWPDPSLDYVNDKNNWNDPKSIDDFWHTAVNGRGQFFSAADPRSVINGLGAALAGIGSKIAAGSAAGFSTLTPTAGNNSAYLASYTTQVWKGDVQAYSVILDEQNLNYGAIDTSTASWSASTNLETKIGQACDNRNIYLIRTDGSKPSNNLANFTWKTSACDTSKLPGTLLLDDLTTTEQSNFTATNASLLSQYAAMTDGTFGTADQRSEVAGANLVNFLRGQHGMEGFEADVDHKLYRTRKTADGSSFALGDIVGGQPVYVQAPFASYNDAGYSAFKDAKVKRTAMLYVAANDGMLHAFYADTSSSNPNAGQEAWAIIPSPMLTNLYQLADNNYQNLHRYFNDGTPVVSDAKLGSDWATLLVGEFNGGGKGYYALDITDPASPKALWEFKQVAGLCPANLTSTTSAAGNVGDCNLGYSFGQPIITKLGGTNSNAGKWVVMFTSGYNNVNSASNGGDGLGFLYVVDARTGVIIYKISTGAGSASAPSGLAQINNYVDTITSDNTSLRVYGTDLLGNIWRFDIDDNILPSGIEVKLLATTKDPGGTPQPITTKPELGLAGGNAMVFVGTGRLLGATDVADLQVQSIYGIVDPLTGATSPSYADLRSSLAPLQFSLVGTGTTRTVACNGSTAQCGLAGGWYIDLLSCKDASLCPPAGERVNVDPKLAVGTLAVASNIPTPNVCIPGGTSWFTQLDYKSGLAVLGAGAAASQSYSDGLIVGFAIIKLPNGSVDASLRFSSGGTKLVPIGVTTNPTGKRVSWREILQK